MRRDANEDQELHNEEAEARERRRRRAQKSASPSGSPAQPKVIDPNDSLHEAVSQLSTDQVMEMFGKNPASPAGASSSVTPGYFTEADLPELQKRWPGITLEEANAMARTGGG